MTTIILTDNLKNEVNLALRSLPPINNTDIDISSFLQAVRNLPCDLSNALEYLIKICRELLRQNGYVHLRGLDMMPDARGILALGDKLGNVFVDLAQQSTVVVEASPTIDSNLQGNQTEALFMHTDFAMLEQPPAVTIIHCRQEDPLGSEFGRNGIAVAQHIVSRLFGSDELEKLYSVSLPFAGRTPSGEDIVIHCPIFRKTNFPELTHVRFHPSRIHHGYRMLSRTASQSESEVLRFFLKAAQDVRIDLSLQPGDFLFVNNRAALHDRSRCSLKLGVDSIQARVTQILFVQELACA
ncbi:MAG: TauD/TfdA family dioxygenase [Methylococcaceae bacterium]